MEPQSSREPFESISRGSRAAYLVAGFIKKTLTMEEEEELDSWLLEDKEHMRLFEELTNEDQLYAYLDWYDNRNLEYRLSEAREKAGLPARTKLQSWSKWVAAASLLIAGVGGMGYYFYYNQSRDRPGTVTEGKMDLLPGRAYATLTLENGKLLVLPSTGDTLINDQIAVRDGAIVYDGAHPLSRGWHEISIPRKAYYRLVLPDSTRVWLNAESNIRFPVPFAENTREVSIKGEVYLEVAADKKRPFTVSINDISVQALGTAFNISAYSNEEALRVTLVEGSVMVSHAQQEQLLRPGQQLSIMNGDWQVLQRDETASVTAWKDNAFRMVDAPITSIMRQIERWYDAQVYFMDTINYHFNGSIDRSVPVSRLLKLLEQTGHVRFEMEGKIIKVYRP